MSNADIDQLQAMSAPAGQAGLSEALRVETERRVAIESKLRQIISAVQEERRIQKSAYDDLSRQLAAAQNRSAKAEENLIKAIDLAKAERAKATAAAGSGADASLLEETQTALEEALARAEDAEASVETLEMRISELEADQARTSWALENAGGSGGGGGGGGGGSAAEVAALQDKVRAMEASQERLKPVMLQARDKISTLTQAVASQKATIADLEARLAAGGGGSGGGDDGARVAELTAAVEAAEAQAQAAAAELVAARAETAAARAEKHQLADQVHRLGEENVDLAARLGALETENEAKAERIMELEVRVDVVDQALADQVEATEAARAEATASAAGTSSAGGDASLAAAGLAAAQAQIESLQVAVLAAGDRMKQAEQRAAESEAERDAAVAAAAEAGSGSPAPAPSPSDGGNTDERVAELEAALRAMEERALTAEAAARAGASLHASPGGPSGAAAIAAAAPPPPAGPPPPPPPMPSFKSTSTKLKINRSGPSSLEKEQAKKANQGPNSNAMALGAMVAQIARNKKKPKVESPPSYRQSVQLDNLILELGDMGD